MDVADLVLAERRSAQGAQSRRRRSPTCRQRGAVALDDAQLKQLIVGKTLQGPQHGDRAAFRDPRTDRGRRLILSVDGKQPPAGEIGDVLHSGELGSPAHYEIRGGKIVTTIASTPFEVSVYKVGDKYVAARSNEFGYANYEVQTAPAATR